MRPCFQLFFRGLARSLGVEYFLVTLGADHHLEDEALVAGALEPLEGEHPGLLRGHVGVMDLGLRDHTWEGEGVHEWCVCGVNDVAAPASLPDLSPET